MLVYTCCLKNMSKESRLLGTCYYISDGEKKDGYESYPALEVPHEVYRRWKNNTYNLSKEENDKKFVKDYFNLVLSKLNPNFVCHSLGGNYFYWPVYIFGEENISEVSIRGVIGAWIDLFDDHDPYISCYEIIPWNNRGILPEGIEDQRPRCIINWLKEAIQENWNTHGFASYEAILEAHTADMWKKEISKTNNDYEKKSLMLKANILMETAKETNKKFLYKKECEENNKMPIKKKMTSDTNYIEWLKSFLSSYIIIDDGEWLAGNLDKLNGKDHSNMHNISILYEVIDNYAKEAGINYNLNKDDDIYYFVKYDDLAFEIRFSRCVTSVKKIELNEKSNFIDYNDIINKNISNKNVKVKKKVR